MHDNESIFYTPKSEFDSKDDEDKDKKTQQNNNIDTRPPKISDYLKSLSQEAKKWMKYKMQTKTLAYISLLLLVVTGKSLTLTFLGSH